MKFQFVFFLLLISIASPLSADKKVILCGICKNVEESIPAIINNMETLGTCFPDYRVIIYENNSTDKTPQLFSKWAEQNPKVNFFTEVLESNELRISRTENIARARNKVLDMARSREYQDFEYLIMVDLDFKTRWPIEEIVNSINLPMEWDCISANGTIGTTGRGENVYYDRYVFRNSEYPLGPEVIGNAFWGFLDQTWFTIHETNLVPVYCAFGGLAIYKTKSILNFAFSGTVTKDLEDYYKIIVSNSSVNNFQIKHYLNMNGLSSSLSPAEIPIHFCQSTNWELPYSDYPLKICVEHITLQASMAVHGFGKFFINPKMIMRY